MTIISKDGSVYVLKSPNPLVKEQEKWDASKLVFHNFHWEDIKGKAPPKPSTKPPPPPAEAIEIPRPEPKQEPEAPKEQPQREEAPKQEDDKNFDIPNIKYKVISYCLPAIIRKKKDSLYGESWERIEYGKKMIFPLIVIESTDFHFDFWTSDPKRQISEKSIIYPFSYEVYNQETNAYDRVPYDEYRWWKVAEKEDKEGGWLFKCVPSETQPDFSD